MGAMAQSQEPENPNIITQQRLSRVLRQSDNDRSIRAKDYNHNTLQKTEAGNGVCTEVLTY